jgi:hypothetical protein
MKTISLGFALLLISCMLLDGVVPTEMYVDP